MKTFNYKKRNFFTLSPHLLGLLFIAVGIIILISPSFVASDNSWTKIIAVGGANILFGTAVVFSYGGILFNFDSKTYHAYYNLCGYKFGTVKKLPAITLVKSMTKQHMATTISNGVHPTMTGMITINYVFIYAEQTKPFLVLDYSTKEESVKVAHQLALGLQARLEA